MPPLIVHLLYRLDTGGMETLLVECINRMPPQRYRHAIVCLTESSAFSARIRQPGVEVYALHKAPGLSLSTHLALYRVLRRLRPALLHTYNLAAIEYHAVALLAGVRGRVHAEHGRDAGDPDGSNRRHNALRRLLRPLIQRFIPVSADLEQWLRDVIHVPFRKNTLILNGVDTAAFAPAASSLPRSEGLITSDGPVIGTVGRLQAVKSQHVLIDAFALLRNSGAWPDTLKLIIVGDGPCRAALQERIAAAGLIDHVWLTGARDDIAAFMQRFTLFALPSMAEGTPITLLEAMACGLPVVASRVGGIPALVPDGEAGTLVPPGDAAALAAALAVYLRDPALARQHGEAGRALVRQCWSIEQTVASYLALYDSLCAVNSELKEIEQPCVE